MEDYFKNKFFENFNDGDSVVVGFDDSAFYDRGGVPFFTKGQIKIIDNQKYVLIEDQLIDIKYIFSAQKVE